MLQVTAAQAMLPRSQISERSHSRLLASSHASIQSLYTSIASVSLCIDVE